MKTFRFRKPSKQQPAATGPERSGRVLSEVRLRFGKPSKQSSAEQNKTKNIVNSGIRKVVSVQNAAQEPVHATRATISTAVKIVTRDRTSIDA